MDPDFFRGMAWGMAISAILWVAIVFIILFASA
jgi:hypothetical protein